ncbi:hypothetical protein ACFQ1M_09135 [Sungkyunkwania multivorans]|uniref:tRNA_anti-like n=1 Tax=Sungkyunkwania multivorans TaxID=1173618 RepID=A0ABW3CYG7_9FLAO
MTNNLKRIAFIILIVIIVLFFGYRYLYQEHRDVAQENAIYSVSAVTLGKEFTENNTAATAKYLDQTIGVSGVVTEVDAEGFTLDNTIYCKLLDVSFNSQSLKGSLQVKGRCIGYDELLELVKLDQVTILDQTNR